MDDHDADRYVAVAVGCEDDDNRQQVRLLPP